MNLSTNRKIIKVLGFDGWTMGAHHYIRLLEIFKQFDIKLILVHLGSWGDDKKRPKEENINGLLVRDISFYNDQDFDQVLDIEMPDVVLFLSTETFLHRAFQRLCKYRHIPTIHLYHGFVSANVYDGKNDPIQINFFAQVRFVLQQAYKTIRHTFPVYARALRKTSASVSDWIRFLKDIFYRIVGKSIFVPASDAVSTKCCIYIAADIQDPISRFGMEHSDVVVVGNPDLITFQLTSELLGAAIGSNRMSENVMYIDSGLVPLGHLFQSVNAYAEYIVDIRNQLNLQHRSLLFKIKPHPPEYRDALTTLLSRENIEIVDNKNFLVKLNICCACIAEPSTLALIPALLGMPLFLTRIGRLEKLRYGSVFVAYPRAQYLDDLNRMNKMLLEEQALCDPYQVMAWINENSGPLPAEDMPKRVAQVVLALDRSKRDTSTNFSNRGASLKRYGKGSI